MPFHSKMLHCIKCFITTICSQDMFFLTCDTKFSFSVKNALCQVFKKLTSLISNTTMIMIVQRNNPAGHTVFLKS